jgi:hypothetical protein
MDVLEDDTRRLGMRLDRSPSGRFWDTGLPGATAELRNAIVDLRRWIEREHASARA